ncbi:hypothetical protein Hamer_G026412 [Homarus americanus]|uniref:Uncharacterized protein n=1 Tax=Homarus americanus TaxID=6706 RepID=A0A8J5JHD3_HOMAM|nr:hypothetical protein Hamer_G026412 [Homarus americanus]
MTVVLFGSSGPLRGDKKMLRHLNSLGVCAGGYTSTNEAVETASFTTTTRSRGLRCKIPSVGNMTRNLHLKNLTSGFFLELDIYGFNAPRLMSSREESCELLAGALYWVTTMSDEQDKMRLTFKKIMDDGRPKGGKEEEVKKVGSEEKEGEGKNESSGMRQDMEEKGMEEKQDTGEAEESKEEEKEEKIMECVLPLVVALNNGYGFLSCRGLEEREEVLPTLKAWRKDVLEAEKKMSALKGKILGGVAGGLGLALVACAVCVITRLRPRHERKFNGSRRPSQQSSQQIKTRVTHDHDSSTPQNSTNKMKV